MTFPFALPTGDLTLFDNSNGTTFVQRLQKVGMFDSDLVRIIRPKNHKSGPRLCSINANFYLVKRSPKSCRTKPK
jgi:hypothetical protein